MALVFWLSGGWSTSATVNINEDGTVTLVTGAVDMGTGYLYTSVPQIVAHELGIRPQDVHLVTGDTDQTTYDHGIGGSRGAFTIGRVAQMAACKAKTELLQAAATMMRCEVSDLQIREGRIYSSGEPDLKISVAEVAKARYLKFGGPLTGSAKFLPEMDTIDRSRVRGLSFSAFKGNTVGCHIAVVDVEETTGRVEIKRYVAAHDVGKAINPMAVEGQIEGGVSMGMGFALTESLEIGTEGQVLNPDFADYKLPTSLDVPETETIAVEIPCAYGPHGAKGLGEPTMAPPAAAIANAIFDAVGVRMHRTPMTPENIVATARKQKGGIV